MGSSTATQHSTSFHFAESLGQELVEQIRSRSFCNVTPILKNQLSDIENQQFFFFFFFFFLFFVSTATSYKLCSDYVSAFAFIYEIHTVWCFIIIIINKNHMRQKFKLLKYIYIYIHFYRFLFLFFEKGERQD